MNEVGRVGRRQALAQVVAGSTTGPLRGYVTLRSLRARSLRGRFHPLPCASVRPCSVRHADFAIANVVVQYAIIIILKLIHLKIGLNTYT